jgi:hypothetical protein
MIFGKSMRLLRVLFLPAVLALLASFISAPASAQQRTTAPPEFVAWMPISDGERQMKVPTVEKDAGAEVLLWRVHIVDEVLGSRVDLQRVFYHYIRLKIFDDRGKERASTIDLPYGDRDEIFDVAGRTIKADGSVVELDPKTVYKRDLVRAGGRSRKVVSFAMPGVEPGAIIEYRWRQRSDTNRIMYVRLRFQRDFPVVKVTYFLKPLPPSFASGYDMFVIPFNCRPSPLQLEPDGYSSTSVENLPAVREEPFAPSEPNVTAWALLRYQMGNRNDPEKYWNDVGRKAYQGLKESLKANDEMKTAGTAAMTGATDNEAKAVALVAVVRKRVRNVREFGVTEAERQKYLKDLPKDRRRTAVETFRSGLGTSDEMNVVFAALAQQVGLEARPVAVPNRNEYIFHPKATVDEYFLGSIDMAVKVGETWKLFDVSTKLLPPGMISWREEGMYALLTDPKNPTFIQTPLSPPESSTELRKARFKLSEDGTLEGDVEESYTGHRAEDSRAELVTATAAQQEEWLRARVTRLFPDSEATGVKIENVDDPAQELRASYHLRVPHYAQVTGKRILLQSSPFRRAQASPFTATDRRLSVEFPYAWKEIDDIRVKLPTGWSLDHADQPGSLDFGQPGSYNLKMSVNKDNELSTSREFTFGRNRLLYFDAKSYPAVKKVFDEIQLRDRHTLSLKAGD